MKIFAMILVTLLSFQVQAACKCSCINGQLRNLCTSKLDIQTPCNGFCPIVTPSIAPLEPIMVPPIGTRSCHNMQVYNQYTRTYQWQIICQ